MFSKELSAVYAVIIYIIFIGLFIGAFNQEKIKPESVHFVKKNDNSNNDNFNYFKEEE